MLTPLIKLRSLTNSNFKKSENIVNETNVPFLPLKLTASYFLLKRMELTINATTRKSWNMPRSKYIRVHYQEPAVNK